MLKEDEKLFDVEKPKVKISESLPLSFVNYTERIQLMKKIKTKNVMI